MINTACSAVCWKETKELVCTFFVCSLKEKCLESNTPTHTVRRYFAAPPFCWLAILFFLTKKQKATNKKKHHLWQKSIISFKHIFAGSHIQREHEKINKQRGQQCSKDATPTQQRNPNCPKVTLTWHTSKNWVHKFHWWYTGPGLPKEQVHHYSGC